MVLFILTLAWITRYAEGQIICPYCDPNYVDIPGLEEACRGYDVPMGNPNPGNGNIDPGIRNQIFNPMARDADGHYVVDGSFVTGNGQIKCDGDFSSRVYDKYEEYIEGLTSSTTTGFGIELGRSVSGSITRNGTKASAGIPPIFSRSWGDNKDVEKVRNFFTKEQGSISVTEAICLTHRIDIADAARKVLLQGFIDSVVSLESFSDVNKTLQEAEFRRFVNEYGTHYQTTSKLGTRIIMERRYSSAERSSSNKGEISECADRAGSKVLGLQVELNKNNCTREDLMEGEINSTLVERMKISTYGSFLAESLADWSKQVVSLVEQKKFYGSVIQRELALISNLFTDDNFPNITRRDGKPLNFTKLLAWFEPMLTEEYCTVFNITCNMTGCGINDKCKLEEWCVYIGKEQLDGKDLDLSPVQKEFICSLRNASIVLKNGNLYTGSTSKVELPHGWGAEFAGTDNSSVIYEGNWVHGKKDGLGSLYTPKSKTPYYSGSMLNDAMWGQGVLYYASGNEMFAGLMANGFIQKGKLYKDSPQSEAISSVDETNIPVVRLNFQNTEISSFLPPTATSQTGDRK